MAYNSANLGEPLLFCIPFGGRPDRYPVERRQPLEHAAGLTEITGLRITLAGVRALSPELETIKLAGMVQFGLGKEHLAEVFFDQGRQRQVADFRPTLPLIFNW